MMRICKMCKRHDLRTCVELEHTFIAPASLIEPLDEDSLPSVVDVPHYRCPHLIDAAFEDFSLLRYDISSSERLVWDELREQAFGSSWEAMKRVCGMC